MYSFFIFSDDFIIKDGNLTVSLAKFNHSGHYICVTMNDIQIGAWANVSTGFVKVLGMLVCFSFNKSHLKITNLKGYVFIFIFCFIAFINK